MSSQPPKVLSTELLNTADAKYVNLTSSPSRGPAPSISYTAFRWISLKKINWQDQRGRTVSKEEPHPSVYRSLAVGRFLTIALF
jgi:hypothetical protein